MGKKVKKDDKAPPEDVFDPLMLESRQPGTVVLMLNSPEEDVLSKACESIYRFAEKCDENKKTLLDLEVVDCLLNLVQNEDRVVRRNACMAVGVMAGHPDVRRVLKKREETISCMVNLLAPEEDTVVHEFAALCLSYLAQDYSSKVAIYEQEGLEPLIQCLSSHDPDVQKNAIETIALMLQDYQAKSAIRDLNGFPPVMELLRSEYAVIQQLALLALHRASEDSENRAMLRELEALNKLIDFIGHPEWNDLHAFAVQVISNCLEDKESVEMIKENGGLMKLVAFITDTQPPEEEEKGKGKDKKGAASRAGKKGKGDDEDKGKGGKMEPEFVVTTLPEVKEHAAKAIARAASNVDNRKLLHEQEVEKMLILLLSHEDGQVQVAAAQALAVMAENLMSREAIAKWDGIEPLIKMMKSDNPDVREAATLALASLTASNMNNCQEVLKLKGIEPMIDILGDSREMAIANAACILTNMAPDEGLRAEIVKQGVINAMVDPLKSTNTVVQSKVALAVAAFVNDADSRTQFLESGGVEPLVHLQTSGNDDVRRSASWAVSVIAVDDAIAEEVCKFGGLEMLQQIQISSTRCNAFSSLALERLLDSNLSAKYALTGSLGPTNMISDGFFDVGQLRPDAQLLTLEEYCKQPINQRRPIIFINARPERTRQQKEKEEKVKEEEVAVKEEPEAVEEFCAPSDAVLHKMIEEVRERIQPLPTSRDQVVALAQYVSERMGGAIERGQVANFSWELPLSQLKFDLKSNVIPIGMIKAGVHYHRALLFKALADRIALNCSLVRGEYNRAWNKVLLTPDLDAPPHGNKRFPPDNYLVDLIHQPGHLMRADSPDAINYQKL